MAFLVSLLIVCVCLHFAVRADEPVEQITINGTKPFITDGTKTLTLKCEAFGMSSPTYFWTGLDECSTGTGTCSFNPKPEDDEKLVYCSATSNRLRKRSVTAKYKLVLQYPPPQRPVFQASETEITCTVHGGKPLVTNLSMDCQDLNLEVTNITRNATSVSYTAALLSPSRRALSVPCNCSAYWTPEPDFYQVATVYDLPGLPPFVNDGEEGEHKDQQTDKTGLIVGVVFSAFVIASIVIIIVLYGSVLEFVKKRKPSQRTSQSGDTNMTSRENREVA